MPVRRSLMCRRKVYKTVIQITEPKNLLPICIQLDTLPYVHGKKIRHFQEMDIEAER